MFYYQRPRQKQKKKQKKKKKSKETIDKNSKIRECELYLNTLLYFDSRLF